MFLVVTTGMGSANDIEQGEVRYTTNLAMHRMSPTNEPFSPYVYSAETEKNPWSMISCFGMGAIQEVVIELCMHMML